MVQPGKLPIHIRVPALEHFVLMSCAHAAGAPFMRSLIAHEWGPEQKPIRAFVSSAATPE
jgi:hypothetical protein